MRGDAGEGGTVIIESGDGYSVAECEHGWKVLTVWPSLADAYPRTLPAGDFHGRSCPECRPDCGDCAAKPGEPHSPGCDVARCLATGGQRLSCDRDHESGDLDCGREIWSGTWPGEADCIRFGWYSKFTDDGWVRCGPDDPDGGPDLNRLYGGEARWDREALRWELEPWARTGQPRTARA